MQTSTHTLRVDPAIASTATYISLNVNGNVQFGMSAIEDIIANITPQEVSGHEQTSVYSENDTD